MNSERNGVLVKAPGATDTRISNTISSGARIIMIDFREAAFEVVKEIKEKEKQEEKERTKEKEELKEKENSYIYNKTNIANKNSDTATLNINRGSIEDVLNYIESKHLDCDGKAFFDDMEASGWKDGYGRPIYNWKNYLEYWMTRPKNMAIQEAKKKAVELKDKPFYSVIKGCKDFRLHGKYYWWKGDHYEEYDDKPKDWRPYLDD